MRGNPNWRDNIILVDVVVSPDNQACIVTGIDVDTITLRRQYDEDADTFTADRSELK
jgi:hypothetical protein